jgi:hypothetical protein
LNKFVDYEKKVRMSEGMFYVTDNISELWFMGATDTYRWLFPLRRWSIGKFSEYSARLSREIQTKWVGGFIESIIDGTSPTYWRIANEMGNMYRIWWALERLTGGDYDAKTSLLYLSVPAAAVMMTIGSAIWESYNDGKIVATYLSDQWNSDLNSFLWW